MNLALALRALRRITNSRQGTVAPMFALSFTGLMLVSGSAVDYGRWHLARTANQAAMDAGALAGARLLRGGDSLANAEAAALTYFDENKSALTPDAQPIVSAQGNRVNLFLETSVKTAIMPVMQIAELNMKIATGAELVASGGTTGNLEISLVLDVTGSMCDDGYGPCTSSNKLDALKEASSHLVNTVVWQDQSEFSSRVGIVPFSTRIRVEPDGQGGDMMKALTNLDPTWSGYRRKCISGSGDGGSEGNGNWQCHQYANAWVDEKIMPCVSDRDGAEEFTDAAPGPNAWLNAHDGSRMPISWSSSNARAATKRGLSENDPSDNWNYNKWNDWQSGICHDVANANQIMPLTADKDKLVQKIDGLEAFGATNGGFATAFGWYMLSPNWAAIWPSQSAPAPYEDLDAQTEDGGAKVRKVAIIMSDGVYNTWRGWKEQSLYWMRDRAKRMCQAMKDAGVEIYTVSFSLDELNEPDRSIAEDTLKSCGTDISHFYNTLNVDELKQAFKSIAYTATTVRLFTPPWPKST